jgi:Co/Zn/Cd efflux system component
MAGASRLIVAGYILAIVFPIVGFVIGIVLVNRSDKREIRHGIWMIVISVLAAFILFVGLTVVSHGSGSEEEGNVRGPVATRIQLSRAAAGEGTLASVEVLEDLVRA